MKRRHSSSSNGSKNSAHSQERDVGSDNVTTDTKTRRVTPSSSSGERKKSRQLHFESKLVLEPEFRKLDPSDPAHVRRIQQRRRMISFGKNTVGYEEYIKQVPKESRRARSMKTPMTPDYSLDIPNKRWTGLVRAWYESRLFFIAQETIASFPQWFL